MTDAQENGDLWRLRPNSKHVTNGYARESKEEIVEVVRLIPQERIRQRTVGQIDDARTTVRRNGRSGPDHSPGAYLRVYHRLNRRCASGGATPSTDCPDSSEDSEGSTSAGPRLSGRRAYCDAAESANVTRHRVCVARCRDHTR